MDTLYFRKHLNGVYNLHQVPERMQGLYFYLSFHPLEYVGQDLRGLPIVVTHCFRNGKVKVWYQDDIQYGAHSYWLELETKKAEYLLGTDICSKLITESKWKPESFDWDVW